MTHFDPDCACFRCHYRKWELRLFYAARGRDDQRSEDMRGEVDPDGTVRFRPATLADQLEHLDVMAKFELRHDVRGEVQ